MIKNLQIQIVTPEVEDTVQIANSFNLRIKNQIMIFEYS